MSFGCTPDFTRRSVGYVGFSDGWQDLMDNFKMDWEFEQDNLKNDVTKLFLNYSGENP